MRPICFIILLIFSNLAYSQYQKPISFEDKDFNKYYLKKKTPIVKGKILNLSNDELKKLKINCSLVTPFGDLQEKKLFDVAPDGTFEIKLDYPLPYQQIWVSFGDLFYTGLYANTDLFIEVDVQVLKSQKQNMYMAPGIKYLGKDGPLNTYLNNHVLYKRDAQIELNEKIYEVCHKNLTPENFVIEYDSLYSILDNVDKEYIQQHPSSFSWILQNERQSAYYAGLCSYYWGKQMPNEFFQKVKKHRSFLTTNDGMTFYNNFFYYLLYLVKTNWATDLAKGTMDRIEFMDSLFIPAKSDFFKLKFNAPDPKDKKTMIETVLPSIKTAWCKNIIQKEYYKTLEKIKSLNEILKDSTTLSSVGTLGRPIAELSFGAKLYRVDSSNAKTLLSNLRNSFKGKALFIDIWATWCAPCIEQFPYSKKLHSETKDLPIEFIYLCTTKGSDIDKWKRKIAEFKLAGTHIYVDENIEVELRQMFSGEGYPTYGFINANGEYKPGIKRPSELNRNKLEDWIK